MLTYNFSNIGSDSLYEYLYKCIKNDILLGNIRPGEKLPSKRTFAKNLGISVITVENAYAQLVAEGYLYSMPKRGFYAADLEIEDSMRDAVPKEILQVANGETSYFADFSSNQTDSEIFPFTIWTRTVRAVLNDNRIQLMINSPCAGILKLRSAIAKYLREFRGMQVLPEQIIVGAGTEYLHNLLIQLLGNDLVYGVEDPGYHKIARIYESMKVRYEPVPLDQDGVSVQELEKDRLILFIPPRPITFQPGQSCRSAAVMNCSAGQQNQIITISLRTIMTVSCVSAESRFRHCRVSTFRTRSSI